eukprot:5688350-Pyramimonas_sp.AAC.1
MASDDEREVQRVAAETERKRLAEELNREATRRILLESQAEAKKPPTTPKAKCETREYRTPSGERQKNPSTRSEEL